MPLSPQEEAEFQQLHAVYGQDPTPQPQAPPDDRGWFTGHALPAVANFIPKFIHASGEGMYGIAGALSGDSDEEIELAKRQRANLYGDITMDKAPSHGLVDTTTDFIGDVAPSVAATAVQAYAGGGIAGGLGAGAAAPIIGDVAAGAYSGAGESPQEAAIQGTQFGLGGAASALLPRRFGALARAGTGALAQGGAATVAELARGRDLSDPEVQRSIAIQAALPVAMEGLSAAGRRFGSRRAAPLGSTAEPTPETFGEPVYNPEVSVGEPQTQTFDPIPSTLTPEDESVARKLYRQSQGLEDMELAPRRLGERAPEPSAPWVPETPEANGLRLEGPPAYIEPPVSPGRVIPKDAPPAEIAPPEVGPPPAVEETPKKLRRLGSKSQEGAISGNALGHIAGGTIGGLWGSTIGDTDEERMQNAAIGAGAGLAIPSLLKGGSKLAQLIKAKSDAHLNGERSLGSGAAVRLQENFSTPEGKIASFPLRAKGTSDEFTRRAGATAEVLDSLPDAEKPHVSDYLNSQLTQVDEAKLMAAPISQAAKNAALAYVSHLVEGQLLIAQSQTNQKADTINRTLGTYRARIFAAHEQPQQWSKEQMADPVLRENLIQEKMNEQGTQKYYSDFYEPDPANPGLKRVKPGSEAALKEELGKNLNEYNSTILMHHEGVGRGDVQQSTDARQGRNLFTPKKDLNDTEFATIRKLSGDVRLDPHEDAVMKHIMANGVDAASQNQLRLMADDPKLAPESEALKAIANKEVLSPAHRAYLGEETNGIKRAIATLDKVSSAMQPATLHNLIAGEKDNAGLEYALGKKEYLKRLDAATQAGDTATLADLKKFRPLSPDTQGVGKLAGMYVQEDALNSMKMGKGKDYAWGDQRDSIMGKSQSWLKKAFTQLSPASHIHNTFQMPLQAVSGGVMPWELPSLLREAKKPDVAARLEKLGILNQRTDEALSTARQFGQQGKVGKTLTKAARWIEEAYNAPDNKARAATFLKEEARQLKKGLSPKAAEEAAIQWTNTHQITPGLSSKAVNLASNVPFLNPFIRYQAGQIGVLKQLAKDLTQGDSYERIHAALALTAHTAALTGIAALGRSMLSKKDQADWDKDQKLAQDYKRGQIRLVVGRDEKTGNFHSVNLGPWMVAGDLVGTAKNILNMDAKATLAGNPFFGLDKSPALNIASSQIQGKEAMTGRKLFTMGDRLRSLAGAALPPPLSALTAPMDEPIGYLGQRLGQAFTKNDEGGYGITNSSTGRTETPATGVKAMFGYSETIDNPRRLAAGLKRDADEEIAQRKSDLKRKLQTNIPSAAKAEAIRRFGEQRKAITEELNRRLGQ